MHVRQPAKKIRMSFAKREFLVFIAVIGCVVVRQWGLGERVLEASSRPLPDEHAFFSQKELLGGDVVILEYLTQTYTNGFPAVSIPWEADLPLQVEARLQRFWLALVPAIPVSGTGTLSILPRHRGVSGEVLVSGEFFVLVERVALAPTEPASAEVAP